jgi:hypothetical protein
MNEIWKVTIMCERYKGSGAMGMKREKNRVFPAASSKFADLPCPKYSCSNG